jgi:hypothetical protein
LFHLCLRGSTTTGNVDKHDATCDGTSLRLWLPSGTGASRWSARAPGTSDHPSKFSWDSPENELKILCPKTGLKCSSVSQSNYFSIKFKWQDCLAATLREYCTTICLLPHCKCLFTGHHYYTTFAGCEQTKINLAVALS